MYSVWMFIPPTPHIPTPCRLHCCRCSTLPNRILAVAGAAAHLWMAPAAAPATCYPTGCTDSGDSHADTVLYATRIHTACYNVRTYRLRTAYKRLPALCCGAIGM